MFKACFDKMRCLLRQKNSNDIGYYMNIKNQLHPGLEAFKIVIIYCLFGIVWIAFPDMILSDVIDNILEPRRLNILKGWVFVGLSSIIIYYFIYSRLKLMKGVLNNLELNLQKQMMIEKELNNIAYYDVLTKLPNRALLDMKCRELMEGNKRFAYVCMDVDNFKNINDTLGHLAGDQFLKYLAEQLVLLNDRDTFVARLGGDEFAIIYSTIHQREEVEYRLQNMLLELQKPWVYEGQRFIISVSMGVVLYPEQANNSTDLLRNSDIAMYEIKKGRKNNYCFYSEGINENNARKVMLTNELHKAIHKEEFQLYYQPIIDIGTRKIVGVEALIRWQHPEQGMISPMDFIPLAEETGLMEEIERWVIKTAFLQKLEWDTMAEGFTNLILSVNISGKSFVQYGFVNYIRNLLLQTGLNSNEIQLEITETVFIDKADITKKVFNDISSMGILIALDDFGTGYSSLTYLKNFPIDIVKLDANFVKGIINQGEDRVIVESVINLTHDLGLLIIAEGIETETQYEVLKMNNCDYGQGYLYSRPVPAEKINELLKNEHPEFDKEIIINQ